MNIRLLMTPIPLDKADVEEKTVVVIDVLSATTSICAALVAGAKGVIATPGPGEAGDMRAKLGGDGVVLAGERNCVRIENFHLGNSPSEFTAETVGGMHVIMTTTNGTLALNRANKGKHVITAGLVNMSRVVEAVAREKQDLLLVCSGREGHFSIEDTICGGMLIHRLTERFPDELQLNDAASLALLLYRTNQDNFRESIAQGEHARFLASIGFEKDIAIATEVDSMPVLPVLRDGRLVNEVE